MKLFESFRIGALELKNRLVMAPMSCNLAKDGFVTERMIRFFVERAKGGVGLITIGDGIVDTPLGNNVRESTAIDDDMYIPYVKKLTQAVKAHGAKMCLQLSHAGRRAGRVSKAGYLDITKGLIPVAPSSIAHPVVGQVVPKELTQEEIEEIVEKFGEASRRAIEAGFDAIGLHCAHMYLCGQFLSPWANKRTDEYGGDFEGRLRFVHEVIERIRKKISRGYPIIVRMNGQEPDGGNSLGDIRRIAQRFEEIGVDAIHVSVGFGAPIKTPDFLPSVTPMRAPNGCIVPLAENIKRAVSIPVIAVNKIGDIDLAEKILEEGRADLIAMGRPLIADPYLPLKGMEGKREEIVPCISCCQGCIQNVLDRDEAVSCTVNPLAAREGEIHITPTQQQKKIMVVGGGPGGLTAAKILVERGHRVIIYEKESELGGQLKAASIPPGKKDILKLKHYLIERIERLGIESHSGEEVDTDLIQKLRPDVLVIATGGKPIIPSVIGIEMDHVVLAKDVLLQKVKVGKSVVIIGGGQVGLEVAEHLAERGKRITVIEILDELARGIPSIVKLPLLCRLEELGVTIWTKADINEIQDKKVIVQYKGSKRNVEADTVIIAAGSKPNNELFEKMKSDISEVFMVGDSLKPRRILEAITEGFETAAKI